MGLSIHYSGCVRDTTLVDELVAEVADICKILNWSNGAIDDSNVDQLKGIWYSPNGCEPIFLTFLPGGRLCSPVNLMNKDIYLRNGLDPELVFTASAKTQFGGADAHMALLKLLGYLNEKYFSTFDLIDEGLYWDTKDESVLLSQFAKYDFMLNEAADALSEMKFVPGETTCSLADRIERILIDRMCKTQQYNFQ